MKILITGGAGYIGSLLTKKLLDTGHEVTVLDNFMYKQASLLDCCAYENFSVINGDARDSEVLKKAVFEKDFVFPLAAIVGFPACKRDQTAAESTNFGAIKELLALRDPETKIVFPCTNSGYGIGLKGVECTEESPIRPISLYGQTKVRAEQLVLAAGNACAFRFATLFGVSPRMRLDLLVNDFVYRAVNDRCLTVFEGKSVRNYLHVQDACKAFLFAAEHFDAMNGQTFNCGLSNANLNKLQLCEKIKEHLPFFSYSEARIGEDPDKRDYIVSNAKIEGIGFQTEKTLDDGIEELIKAYSIIKNQSYGNY